ncbi:MAG: PAS domain-containing protein, partial [Sphingomicrobium sp.]
MLHQELPPIDIANGDGLGRWLVPSVAVAAGLSMAILLLLYGQPLLAGLALLGGAAAGVVADRFSRTSDAVGAGLIAGPDFSLVGAAMSLATEPAALTDGEGRLLIANPAYRERFGSARPPLGLASDEDSLHGLEAARTMAWRDGAACAAGIETEAGALPVEVERIGASGSHLLWRFPDSAKGDPLTLAVRRMKGVMGERLAAAGIMVAVIDSRGVVQGGNALFDGRALGAGQQHGKVPFRDLIRSGENQCLQLRFEGEEAPVLRGIYLPLDPDAESGAGTFLILDNGDGTSRNQAANVQALLDVLPVGLALVDRDGRFLTLNQAFRQAAGIAVSATPVYPGDLVAKEDKAAVADAVRRNARGPAMSGDIAVRLAHLPGEPVALTVAGLRGLGEAVVLLLLKDNSEEAKLKRQVAQATKMQLVGQLAG